MSYERGKVMNTSVKIEVIETERLILRGWSLDDAEDLYDYARNPNVGPHGGWKPHESVEESKKIITKLFLGKYDIWAMVDKQTGKVIGSIGFEKDTIRDEPLCLELGYAMAEDYWGRGLMTEAAKAVIRFGFEKSGLEMISIYRNPVNYRSERVIEKCHFIYEGTLRRANKVYTGEIRDAACYSMLRKEFEEIYSS